MLAIGSTAPADEAETGVKDAIHVPVVLAISDDEIKPGDSVRFVQWGFPKVTRTAQAEWLGDRVSVDGLERTCIADPFASEIPRGHAFWVFVRPGMVKNIRHTWSIENDTDDASDFGDNPSDPTCGWCFNED